MRRRAQAGAKHALPQRDMEPDALPVLRNEDRMEADEVSGGNGMGGHDSMNRVILIGNLTRDPELRTTGSGISVCSFSIAVNRRFKNAQTGQQETDYLNVIA